jgi:hypothetical protein
MASKKRLDPTVHLADAFIGITTNLPVIQLVHFINRESLLKLVREKDLPVYNEKTDSVKEFKFFLYEDDDYRSTFCLVNNNNDGSFVLATHKQFNYFLFVFGAIPGDKVKQLISKIKSIPGVQLAAIVPQEPVKQIESILIDLELHLTDLQSEKDNKQKQFMPLAEAQ